MRLDPGQQFNYFFKNLEFSPIEVLKLVEQAAKSKKIVRFEFIINRYDNDKYTIFPSRKRIQILYA